MGVTLVRFDFDRGTKVWKDEQLENLPGMLKGYTDSSISTAIESKKKLLNFSQLPKRWQERYSEAAEAARKDAKGEKEKFNNKEEDPSDALVLKHLKKTFDLTTFNALKLDWFLAKSVLQTRRNEGTA